MDTVTRRRFLITSGVVGATALAGGAAYSLRDILDTAGEKPEGAKTLVVVTLYGGNDGLATVVPYADAAYQQARPELAYQPDQVLRLDGALGLNPALKGLKAEFDAGRLAVVNGVGYPKPDRSHFRSMDIWQTAQPDRPGNTGWLGRWLDASGGDPRSAVSFEPVLPPLLAGETAAGAAVPLTGLRLPNGVKPALLSALGRASAGEPAMQARAAQAFADLVRVDDMITDVNESAATRTDDDDDAPAAATGTGGRNAIEAQLDLVAKCIAADVATRVFSVSLGGFDLHADEKQAQEVMLGRLDEALAAFTKQVAGKDVVVLVYSEFGRRVRANGSDGTDHGTAGPLFVLGDVRGGLYGEQPSLTDLADGDLKSTVDFRDVYATLLEGVLATDAERVLGKWSGRIPKLLAL